MSKPDATALRKALEEVASIDRCDCGAPTLSDFQRFEMRTGVPVPEEVREWLSLCNGAYLENVNFLGLCPSVPSLDIEQVYAHQPGWLQRRWLPIADDGCGNYYVVATQQEYGPGYPVFFVEAVIDSSSPAYAVASSVGWFVLFALEREHDEEGWPFDREYVVARDPEIVSCTGLPMPWDIE